MALICKDKIEVETDHGLCTVELHFGSITKVDPNDPVDVLVVSAFPGDYSPTPTSVIGALWRDLKVKVYDLAKNKEEDLRSFFSCWWSKPVAAVSKLPFKRLMCFEGGFKRGATPPAVVGEVFRSLVSLCKNKDIKVVMPLLAAGDQGFSQKMMLGLIVDAAIHWMQVGLPLRSLRIVIYCRDPEKADLANDPLLAHFHSLKAKWLTKMNSEETKPQLVYDVYLSFCPADESLAHMVRSKFVSQGKDIKIFAGKQEVNCNESWQEEIYKLMITCSRVVTLLTPEFLKHSACIEQYNIALCCTRTMKRDYLAPFYIEDISNMPTYMSLIQYKDCRPKDNLKIAAACNELYVQISCPSPSTTIIKVKSANPQARTQRDRYEVFISYAHADDKAAGKLKEYLHSVFPDWRIFIDTSSLQVGNAWQVTLYNSIEASKVIVSLISPAYIASKVCQEEYNLAAFLQKDPQYRNHLVPIMLDNVDTCPFWCEAGNPVRGLDFDREESLSSLVPRLRECVAAYDNKGYTGRHPINVVLSAWRSEHVTRGMPFLPGMALKSGAISSVRDTLIENEIDIFLSFHAQDQAYGDFLVRRLKILGPKLSVSVPDHKTPRHALLDKAYMIVPLISAEYLNTPELFEELNIAMCRHRFADHMVVLPILLEPLAPHPAFVHLLCTLFALEDSNWRGSIQYFENTLPPGSAACLNTAAICLTQFLAKPESCAGQFKILLSVEEITESLRLLRCEDYSFDVFHPLKLLTNDLQPSAKNECEQPKPPKAPSVVEPSLSRTESETPVKGEGHKGHIDESGQVFPAINDELSKADLSSPSENHTAHTGSLCVTSQLDEADNRNKGVNKALPPNGNKTSERDDKTGFYSGPSQVLEVEVTVPRQDQDGIDKQQLGGEAYSSQGESELGPQNYSFTKHCQSAGPSRVTDEAGIIPSKEESGIELNSSAEGPRSNGNFPTENEDGHHMVTIPGRPVESEQEQPSAISKKSEDQNDSKTCYLV